MNILAIDASGPLCSVAVETHQCQIVEKQDQVRSHSQYILPMIDNCLNRAEIALSDIELCVYGKGPGSFTGLRLVAAIVQAFSIGNTFTTHAVSTLQAKAQHLHQLTQAEHIIICDDARMQEVYFGEYKNQQGIMQLMSKELCVAPNAIIEKYHKQPKPPLMSGTGLTNYPEFEQYRNQTAEQSAALVTAMIEIAKRHKPLEYTTSATEILPSYIRTPTYKKK